MTDRHATVTATGSYVPDRVVTNAELSDRLGEDIDDFVSNATGDDLYLVVDQVVQKGIRQLTDFKDKLRSTHR